MDTKMMGDPAAMPMDDMPEAAPMARNEQCVPTAALAMPDDTEQMNAPEVGDAVSYTVDGKVTRIEGDKTYVEPEMVNGKPMAEEAPEAPVDEMASMEQAAGEQGYL